MRGAGRSSRGTKPLLFSSDGAPSCRIRSKRLVDLMVEPMSFDWIGNLGKSSTMKARLQEEVRLVEIAQGTRVRYTEMGVFSAVAGNQ